MTDEALASRTFTMDDQIAFARLSSDWNPMHLDAKPSHGAPRSGRRWCTGSTISPGRPMPCCDRLPSRLRTSRARFLQPLYLDELASDQNSRSDRTSKSSLRSLPQIRWSRS